MRREVYRRYHVSGVRDPSCGDPRCELGHRIPRSCGGADDVGNLWPQSTPYWHEKDLLEDYAARRVKEGAMSPEQCQALFLAPVDWREVVAGIGHRPFTHWSYPMSVAVKAARRAAGIRRGLLNMTSETISARAYELWEKEGRPDGRDWAHWLEAERMLTQQRTAPASTAVHRDDRPKGRRPR
jgi:hypothetical protein